MKLFIALMLTVFMTASCGVRTTGSIDVDPTDLKYFQDKRTGLCFSIVASARSFSFASSGLGSTNVPCNEKVLGLIGN